MRSSKTSSQTRKLVKVKLSISSRTYIDAKCDVFLSNELFYNFTALVNFTSQKINSKASSEKIFVDRHSYGEALLPFGEVMSGMA